MSLRVKAGIDLDELKKYTDLRQVKSGRMLESVV